MNYTIEVKEVPAQPTASITVRVPRDKLGETFEQLFPEVWNYLMAKGVHPAGPPYARYHTWEETATDIECGMPVAAPVIGEGRIVAGELPGGKMATTMHVGPYDKLPQAFDAVHKWLEEHGVTPTGAPWEVYWTDPGENPNRAEWKTEVVWPVA